MTMRIGTWAEGAHEHWSEQVRVARDRHEQWVTKTAEEQAALEKKYASGEEVPTPPLAIPLEAIMRVEVYEAIPNWLQTKCSRYG